ncbi:hypothetical protein DAT35_55720 [Vitiosangium sp. GDMCC 1.1324]|nr:hypothetical protein DAT35_55720 [Vitiosangium sp. GDMCC 1.1324]
MLLSAGSAFAYEANDQCGSAQVVNLGAFSTVSTFSGNTCNATPDTLSHCRPYAAPDVFYRFTVNQRSLVYVDAFSSTYDTVLFFTDVCSTEQNKGFECVDDQCGTLQSQMVQLFEPGTYYLVVSGFGGQCGAFNIHFQHLPASDVLYKLPESSQFSSSTDNMANRGVPLLTDRTQSTCSGSYGGRDVTHYYTTCPSYLGGTLSATTCGLASFDTVLYFRQGNTPAVACNDDACGLQSTISGAVTPGAALRALYTDGYSSSSFGDFSINLSRP